MLVLARDPRHHTALGLGVPPLGGGRVARLCDGGRAVDHDLSALKGHRLRTHGSLHEADVPFVLSRPLKDEYARRCENGLRSHNLFEFALNGTEEANK